MKELNDEELTKRDYEMGDMDDVNESSLGSDVTSSSKQTRLDLVAESMRVGKELDEQSIRTLKFIRRFIWGLIIVGIIEIIYLIF